MNQLQSSESLPIELYNDDEVMSGQISCPSPLRLLDLLNGTGVETQNGRNEFFTFEGFLDASNASGRKEMRTLYIRKAAIHLVAVDEVDLGRGVGAGMSQKGYPLVHKSSVRVTLRLRNYKLIGNVHCVLRQTVQDLLNSNTAFLPLTDVTLIREEHVLGTRPFVAVNKAQIIWSQQE